jgi:hypothetical protein
MVTTWTPFILAAASGLAFVAYSYADFYDALTTYIMLGLLLTLGVALCWSMAVMRTFHHLSPLVKDSDEAWKITERLSFNVPRLAFVCGCVLLYLWLLTLLPAPQ